MAHAGRTVRFLLHSDYDFVLQHGLQVDSCDGSFHLDHIDAYGATKDMPLSDVIIVGLKTVKNHDVLPELLRPIVNDDTVVILIQNGIGLEEDLQRLFPKLRIIAGLAFICSARHLPGTSTTNAMAVSTWATIPVLTTCSIPSLPTCRMQGYRLPRCLT